MTKPLDVDVWVRGTNQAHTEPLTGVSTDASGWTDDDVRSLLAAMLLAIARRKNPGDEPPPVTLRGFNWIVSRDDAGVLVHVEMMMGTASAGPFTIDQDALSAMITRVMAASNPNGPTVH